MLEYSYEEAKGVLETSLRNAKEKLVSRNVSSAKTINLLDSMALSYALIRPPFSTPSCLENNE